MTRMFNSGFLKGVGIGVVVPIISFLLIYSVKFSDLGLERFLTTMVQFNYTLPILSLSVIPNMAIVYFLMNRNKMSMAQGMVFSILLWALVIVYFEFFS